MSQVQFIVEAIMDTCPQGVEITIYEEILAQAALIAARDSVSENIFILSADSVVVNCTEIESLFRRLGSRMLEPFLVTSEVSIQTASLCIDTCDFDESSAMQSQIENLQGDILASVNDGAFETIIDIVASSMGKSAELVDGFEQMVQGSFRYGSAQIFVP